MASEQKPELFELNNGSMQVKITNYGATIVSLSVPDKYGIFSQYPFDWLSHFAIRCFADVWVLGI